MTDRELDVGELGRLLRHDSVLALGEPTHGSANVAEWRTDVTLELARAGALRTVALEEVWEVGHQLDTAVRNDLDTDAAWELASSFWDRTATRLLWRGLRALNRERAPQDRVGVLGLDVRKPHLAARALVHAGHATAELAALAEQEPLDDQPLSHLVSHLREVRSSRDFVTRGRVDQLLGYVDTYLAASDLGRLHRRDRHLAGTVLRHLPQHGITALWAHNEHVARNPEGFGGPAMGWYLDRRLGSRYLPVGVLCGHGTCRAVDPSSGSDDYRTVALPPAPADSTESAYSGLDEALIVTSDQPHPGPRRFIGWKLDPVAAERDPESYLMRRPASDFSAIKMFHLSTAS